MTAFKALPEQPKNALLLKLNRLDEKLETLLDEFENAQLADLTRTYSEGQWSALQIAYHVMLYEQIAMRYVKRKLSFARKLNKSTMATTMRKGLLVTYLRTNVKYKTMKSADQSNFPMTISLYDLRNEWLTSRKELRIFVEDCPSNIFDKEIYKHPFAGKLSLDGMLTFFEEHFDRHRKQILRRSGV